MQCKFKKEKKKKPNKKIVYKNLHTVGCSYSLENRKKNAHYKQINRGTRETNKHNSYIRLVITNGN